MHMCVVLINHTQHQLLMSTLSAHGLPSVKCCRLEEEEDRETARKCLRSILFLPKLLKLVGLANFIMSLENNYVV